jgi:hypothetical protein
VAVLLFPRRKQKKGGRSNRSTQKVIATKSVELVSVSELSDKYAARFGSPSMSSVSLEEFMQVLELVATKYRGFLYSKWMLREGKRGQIY